VYGFGLPNTSAICRNEGRFVHILSNLEVFVSLDEVVIEELEGSPS